MGLIWKSTFTVKYNCLPDFLGNNEKVVVYCDDRGQRQSIKGYQTTRLRINNLKSQLLCMTDEKRGGKGNPLSKIFM
jgi:hypothetical protein